MSLEKSPQHKNHSVMGFEVSDDIASGASTAGHLVAGFIPNPLVGGVIDFAASNIDMEANQASFVKTWKSAIARKLHVHELDLEGDAGVAIVEAHIHELPPALQEEWNKIEDVDSKTSNFLASGFAQIGGGALVGTLLGGVLFFPLGMIAGFAGGLGAGYLASMVMKDVSGESDDLTASEVIPAIHQSAMQLQQEYGKNKGAVPIDTTLLGAYLIAAHSAKGDVLEGYNSEDLKRMFNDHMAAKSGNPHAHTELDDYIQGLNRADDNPFVLLLPQHMDANKIKGGGVLQTIAMNMHSQQDLENWLFDPEMVKSQMAEEKQRPAFNQEQLKLAGKSLHTAMGAPMHSSMMPASKQGKDRAIL
jgi:hypothetical protein